MTATLFALVSTEDRTKIFAYGLDINLPSGRDVITFRRDHTGQNMFGVHQTVESARQRFSAITPLELVWEPACPRRTCITQDDHKNDDTYSYINPTPSQGAATDLVDGLPHNTARDI